MYSYARRTTSYLINSFSSSRFRAALLASSLAMPAMISFLPGNEMVWLNDRPYKTPVSPPAVFFPISTPIEGFSQRCTCFSSSRYSSIFEVRDAIPACCCSERVINPLREYRPEGSSAEASMLQKNSRKHTIIVAFIGGTRNFIFALSTLTYVTRYICNMVMAEMSNNYL